MSLRPIRREFWATLSCGDILRLFDSDTIPPDLLERALRFTQEQRFTPVETPLLKAIKEGTFRPNARKRRAKQPS